MASREFNAFDIAWLNRKGYLEKFRGVFGALLIAGVVLSMLALFAGFLQRAYSGQGSIVSDVYFGHLSMIFGNAPYKQLDLPESWISIESSVGVLFSFVVAGLIAVSITYDVTPIEIARYSIIHTDGSDRFGEAQKGAKPRFEIRYFVKMPDGEHLSNAIASFSIAYKVDRTVGRGMTRTIFRHEEQYYQVRGVRLLSIDLDKSSEQGITLREALDRLLGPEGKDLVALARVSGQLGNGHNVSCAAELRPRLLADGCMFASIRHSTCTGNKNSHGGVEYIYFNHFEKLYPCENGSCMGLDASPEVKAAMLEKAVVAPSLYDRLRNLTRQPLRQVYGRIQRVCQARENSKSEGDDGREG